MQTSVLLVLALLGTAFAETPGQPCQNNQAEFTSLSIVTSEGECVELPCNIRAGEKISMELTFIAPEDIGAIHIDAIAKVLGITTHYPMPNADEGCDNVQNSFCPFSKGDEIVMVVPFETPNGLPHVAVDLEMSMTEVGNTDNKYSCFRAPLKIVA